MRARAGGVEDGLGVGGLDGGGDVGNVVREEAAGGRAALAVSRVVNVNTIDIRCVCERLRSWSRV